MVGKTKKSGSWYRYLSIYARRLSSRKKEADRSERGDPLDPVTLDVVVSFALSVAVNLTAKPVAEESYVPSRTSGPR